MKTRLSITTILIAISGYCHAQDIPIAAAQFRYNFPDQLKGQPNDTKASFTEQNYFFSFPIALSGKTSLLGTARYNSISPSLQTGSVPATTIFDHNYQAISLRLALIRQLDDQWNIQLALAPTLSSDFESDLSGKDLILQTQVIAHKKVNEEMVYGFGLSYGTTLGKKMVLPVLQLDYHANQFNITALLPVSLYVYYSTLSNNLRLGGAIHISGGNFHIADVVENDKTVDRVGYRNITIGPSVNIKIAGPLFLNLDGGYDLARKFATYSENDLYDNFRSENGLFVQAGISLVPSLIKRKKE